MLWTSFVCGFVGSIGASIGVVIMMTVIGFFRKPKDDEMADRLNMSNDLLDQRNYIGREMVQEIRELVRVIEGRSL